MTSRPEAHYPEASPRWLLLRLWGLAAVLTVVGASELRARVLDSLGARAQAVPEPAQTPTAPAASKPQPRVVKRVLLIGASSMKLALGTELERLLLTKFPGVSVTRKARVSTGLTRPDVFDWPAAARQLVEKTKPDLVIANFGGNDAQSLPLRRGRSAKFGTPDWDAAYAARVREIVKIARDAGALAVMLGMPTMREPGFSRRIAHVNAVTEKATAEAGGVFVSLWGVGAGPDGRYQEFIVVDGVARRSRLPDGTHLTRAGAEVAVAEIMRRLEPLAFAHAD